MVAILVAFFTIPDMATELSPSLEDYVSHFEFLDYDAIAVHRENTRHKRSLPQDGHKVPMDFFSHGRRFQLDLHRDYEAFGDRLEVIRGDHTGRNDESITDKVDTSHMYHGKVRGISNSLVIGYCEYHPVARIAAVCDTILPIRNLAKNAILLL